MHTRTGATRAANDGAKELVPTIDLLEQRTLLVYIRIAKSKKHSRKWQTKLVARINGIQQILEDETGREKLLHAEWSEHALAAEIENKKLVHTVAELRAKQCELVLTSLQRTHNVLNAVVEALNVGSDPAAIAQ